VDPAAVLRALVSGLAEAGADVRSGAEVVALDTAGRRVRGVTVAGGETVRAASVLMAVGAWSAQGELGFETAAPEVRPVKGQLLELRLRGRQTLPAQRLIRTPRCYVVCRRGGEVVIGATMEEQGFDTSVTAGGVYGLLEAAYEVLPDTAELELVRTHAGLRPFTPDGLPVIEPGALPGLVWATGHGRNGVLLAPVTARRVLALVRERARVGSA